MDKNFANYFIRAKAQKYLQDNPERFTKEEKIKFLSYLDSYLNKNKITINDEIFDFLQYEALIKKPNRINNFTRYITSKYSSNASIHNIADIGAGRMCRSNQRLVRSGYTVTAIDPNIRLTDEEINDMQRLHLIRDYFYCDEFAPNNNGTDVSKYDLLVGLEPCNATEHIIRQGLKYNKPFEVSLCYEAHDPLTAKKVNTPKDWYSYLKSISSEVKIKELNNGYEFIATNN